MVKEVTLTVDLVNGILQYLGGRPYTEVYGLIEGIGKQVQPQVSAPADTGTAPE